MTKRTRKINRLKGGASENNNESDPESDPETNESEGFKKKTKKALELIAKSPAMVGLRGRYFVKEEMCQFDINRPPDYKGNKTQDNLRTKLNKCKLFNEDPALKKYMKEKLIDSCKTYHDVTEITRERENGELVNKFTMKYFNHCTNFFECFHDTSELVYLFKDAIEGDDFLKTIIREKDEEKIRREINEKTQARYKEVVEKGRIKESDNSMSKQEIKREQKIQEVMDKRAKEKDDIDLKQEKIKNLICDKRTEISKQFLNVKNEIPEGSDFEDALNVDINIDIKEKMKRFNINARVNERHKGITDSEQEKEIYEILIEAIQYVLIEEGKESSYQAKDTSDAITLRGAPEKMNKIKQDFIENEIIPRIEKRIKAIMILRREKFNEEKAKLEENRNKFTDKKEVTQLIQLGIRLSNIEVNYLQMYENVIKYAFLEAMKKNKMKHLRILIKNKLEDRKKLKKGRGREVLQGKFDKLEADIKEKEKQNESAKKRKEEIQRLINRQEALQLSDNYQEDKKAKIGVKIQNLKEDLKGITFTDKDEIDNLKKERRKLGLQLNEEDIGFANKKDKERKMLRKLESINKNLEEFSDRKLDKSTEVIEFKKEYETGIINIGEGKTDVKIREFIEEEIQKEIGEEKVKKNKQTIGEYKTAYIEFIKAEVDKKLYGETETIIKKDDLVSFADKTGEASANGYNGDLEPLPVQIRYQEDGISLIKKCDDLKNREAKFKSNEKADIASREAEENANQLDQQLKAKKRILVFFINNIFLKNIREYAALNNKTNFEFKDKISKELSKILNFDKYREKIDKLDKDKNYRKNIENLGDVNFIDNNMFDEIPIITKNVDKKIEEGKKFFRVRKTPDFGAKENNLYKKLTENQVLKGIFDYYGVLMKAEYLMEKGAIPRDDKYEELKFGPSMFMYVVLGFLASAVGLEFMNYNKNRVGGIGD